MRAYLSITLGRAWQKWKEFLLIGHTKVWVFLILIGAASLVSFSLVHAQFVEGAALAAPYLLPKGIEVAKEAVASAPSLTPEGVANAIITAVSYVFLGISRLFLSLTVFCLDYFLKLAAYNAFIDAPPVVVGWFMVRDLANMFFIVALLVIAFSTMLGFENYAWKKSLVQLIMAAILINFSRLILGLFIDVSHVITLTFLNAVEGAAGGNLINMLQLDKILQISTNSSAAGNESIHLDLLAGAAAALIFSIISLFTIGAYAFLMLVRVLILWMLIILSPLAFVLSALPQTNSYAKEFWGEFTKYIIVGPMMAFFLWLSFATLGNGDISASLGGPVGNAEELQGVSDLVFEQGNESPSVSINAIARWENLSGFFIAVGFLLLGIERVQKIGLRGSDIAGSIISAGKKVTKGALKAGAIAGTGYLPYKYGKYYGQVGIEKVKQGYYKTLGAKDGELEGRLSEYQATTKAVRDTNIARGSRTSGAGSALSRATVALETEKARGNAEQKKEEYSLRDQQMEREKAALEKKIAEGEKRDRNTFAPGQTKYTDEQRAKFVGEYLEKNGNSMPMLASVYQDALLKRTQGGYEGKTVGQLAAMRDMDRVIQGQDPKEVMLSQDEAHRKAMADYAKFNFQERSDAIRKNIREIDKAKAAGDQKALAAARGNMDSLIHSSLENGEGTNLMNILREEKAIGFKDITESAEDIPQIILGLQGALEKRIDPGVSDDEKMQKLDGAQKDLVRSLGGKAQGSFRNLATSMDRNAELSKSYQYKGQVRRGLDTENDLREAYGFTRAMGIGTNAQNVKYITDAVNNPDKMGTVIQDRSVEYARRDQRISGIERAPTVFTLNVDGRAESVVDGDMQRLIESLGNADASTISGIKKSIMNVLSGGTEMKGGFNGTGFDFANSDIKEIFKKIVADLEVRVSEAVSGGMSKTEVDYRQKALDTFIKSAAGDATLTRDKIEEILDNVERS